VKKWSILVQAAIYASILSACGDDSGGEVEPPVEIPLQTGGIWNGTSTGTIDSSPAANAVNATAAIAADDATISIFTTEAELDTGISQFRLVSDSAIQAVGQITVTEGETSQDDAIIEGSFTAYAPDGFFFSFNATTAACSLTGFLRETIDEDLKEIVSIDADYECRDKDQLVTASGRLLADYNAMLYEQPSSISRIAGGVGDSQNWCGLDFSTTNNNVELAFDIFNDGTQGIVNGENIEGCKYTGAIDIIDPAFNLYGITLTASACQFLDGPYSGLATYKAGTDGAPDEFIYQIDNGTSIVTQSVYRGACAVN
jgi:hypothetical protein